MASKYLSDQLKDLTLEDVISNNKELGRGAYGKVFTVEYLGLSCAAKEIHSLLLDGVSPEEKRAIKDGFIRECYHSSLIRHPNIVQFMGVYYAKPSDPRVDLPIMVMELMDTSLTSFIENNQSKITINTKLSILHDVSLGLTYLHGRHPPVIHRDLSSNNVLLTSHFVAKISDLGTAKMIRADSKQTKSRLTTAPGTLHFMPPETLDEDEPIYGTPVDVFSFAGVTVHLFSEEWPKPSAQKKRDPSTKKLVALSEPQRRQQYLDKIPAELISLKEMMMQCLDDDADERPPIREVSKMIGSLKDAGKFIVLAQSTECRWQRAVQHERSLRVQLQEDIETLASEMHSLEACCQENSKASASGIFIGDCKPHPPGLLGEYSLPLPGKPMQFGRVSSEGTSKASSVKELDAESVASTQAITLDSTDGGLSTSVMKEEDEDSEFFDALEHYGIVTSSVVAVTTEGVMVKDSGSAASSSVTSTASTSPKIQWSRATSDKEDHLPGPERIDRQLSLLKIASKQQPTDFSSDTSPPLPPRTYSAKKETPSFAEALQSGQYHLKWTTCADLPTPMCNVHVAVSNGTIYCTGVTANEDNWNDVYSFDTKSSQWKKLPRPGHCLGVIHMVDDKPTIFGGRDPVTNDPHNKVTTYNSKTNSWYSCYPNMLYNRSKPGVITSHDYVIVMGGESTDHDNIEVMNYHQMQWKEICVHLPVPMWNIRPTITGDYITIVGYSHAGGHYNGCYQIPVQDIMSSLDHPLSTSAVTSQWKELSPAPHWATVTVPYSNPPVIMGGSNPNGSVPTSDVSVYDSSNNSWRKVDSLTSAKIAVGVSLINDNTVIIIGGNTKGGSIVAAMSSSLTLVEIGNVVANQ